MPAATADWESFRGTDAMFFACMCAWMVLGVAYSWLI